MDVAPDNQQQLSPRRLRSQAVTSLELTDKEVKLKLIEALKLMKDALEDVKTHEIAMDKLGIKTLKNTEYDDTKKIFAKAKRTNVVIPQFLNDIRKLIQEIEVKLNQNKPTLWRDMSKNLGEIMTLVLKATQLFFEAAELVENEKSRTKSKKKEVPELQIEVSAKWG